MSQFNLNQNQFKFLKLNLINTEYEKYFNINTANDVPIEITLADDIAFNLVGFLTEKLAKIGFDDNYELTKNGEIIESIIDIFNLTD